MHAVVIIKDSEVETVIIRDKFDEAVDRAVAIAADYDLFNRWDEKEEESIKQDFRRNGEFEKDEYKIVVTRAFR